MTLAAAPETNAAGVETPKPATLAVVNGLALGDLAPARFPNLADDCIGPLPQLVAQIDARQTDARIEVWRAANSGFDALLREGAPPAQALRRLALTHWTAGNPRLASLMLATAAAIAPELSEIWLDLGFTLQAIGAKGEARLALERALALDPSPARAWLGLAVVCNELADKPGAEAAFAAALERDAKLSEAAFGLGLICFEQRRYAEAAARFRAAIGAGCRNGLAHVGLGQSLFFLGDFAGAARELESQIVAADPTLIQRYALARYLEAAVAADIENAEAAYLRAAAGHAEDLQSLAKSAFQILSAYGHREGALRLARARLAGQTQDPVQRYLVDAVAGEKLERAPQDYLIAYFDQFAESFDKQLVEVLGYRVPQELMSMIATRAESLPRAVDLGCGTGLAGPLLRGGRLRVVGVDLSPRMLAKAAQRHTYDALVEADMMTFLRETQERFDLVLAADALVYLGNLAGFFQAAAQATPPGAILAFNVETTTRAPYLVLPSGKFAHDLSALPRMAAPWFELVTHRRAILRSEANGKVEGALVLMQRREAAVLGAMQSAAEPATLAA